VGAAAATSGNPPLAITYYVISLSTRSVLKLKTQPASYGRFRVISADEPRQRTPALPLLPNRRSMFCRGYRGIRTLESTLVGGSGCAMTWATSLSNVRGKRNSAVGLIGAVECFEQPPPSRLLRGDRRNTSSHTLRVLRRRLALQAARAANRLRQCPAGTRNALLRRRPFE
jgi:hypothetical protein